MKTNLKLFQILEKASIDTKIAVEIQEWIEDSLERNRNTAMFQIEESKFRPFQNDLKQEIQGLRMEMQHNVKSLESEIHSLRTEMQHNVKSLESEIQSLRTEMQHNVKFLESEIYSLRTEMELRFQSLQTQMNQGFQSLNFTIRLLGVPIIGATLSALGLIFIKIWETIH